MRDHLSRSVLYRRLAEASRIVGYTLTKLTCKIQLIGVGSSVFTK